ncbi:YeeE/YedE family protein [Sedimenticola hydrogenitrophicus]|uniref:YeeE/YedE family protein n=1 Tax=Sedimenticola hydrogenitrophicus TaxID=2967975 RepID=UPI0021A91573|nr:YeeE/YedE family protein [Sedimenticola hydrogenitrophicus]
MNRLSDVEKVSPTAPASRNGSRRAIQWGVFSIASLVILVLVAFLATPRLALLLLLGVALGITLQHGAFGFTSAYRRFLLKRETPALQAQLLMLAVATLLFAPFLSEGQFLGRGLIGAWAPAGLQVAAGAFLFGIGMQLGDGCGSGTLYKAGGGAPRMVITLLAFCAGSFWASLHMVQWQTLPALQTQSLAEPLGYPLAVTLQLGFIGLLALLLRRWGVRRDAAPRIRQGFWKRLSTGPWSLPAAALALALLGLATLLTAGHPWTITWAFTLWGAKAALLLGWDPATSAFWTGGFQQAALQGSVLQDVTSVMDIGILLGALAATGLGGRFAPSFRIPMRSLAAAIIGGVLMGYGARIAYGCNIGAFFSGVASLSLHGWLWIICALAGSVLGVCWRPHFGLSNR